MAWKVLKRNIPGYLDPDICEIMIDSADDLTSLPEDAAAGSQAYTASLSMLYIKSIAGEWTDAINTTPAE